MLTGQKGVKYGLTIPSQKQKPKAAGVKGPIAAFAQDDSDDEGNNVGRAVARQAATKRTDKKVEAMHAAALQEDASVFDYDGVYDTIQETREQPKQAEKLARKSRYIESLLDKAKEREREQDIVYERRLAKERQLEDHLYGDKEKFVTGAYKRKLEEEAKWKAEAAIREAREAQEDVVKRGHMGDFYKNLLTNNTMCTDSTAVVIVIMIIRIAAADMHQAAVMSQMAQIGGTETGGSTAIGMNEVSEAVPILILPAR
ncbi:hypothetical protein WJX72_006688 [[Myrmecia] bisecta]|uniref:Nuclear speckle splicing regulatory protein 1 N-terminal domain-containing protein n=1 Tax=[Myrmecia] bisecta TaxID=41462 RepID=A0AAW1Q434_9CHLO